MPRAQSSSFCRVTPPIMATLLSGAYNRPATYCRERASQHKIGSRVLNLFCFPGCRQPKRTCMLASGTHVGASPCRDERRSYSQTACSRRCFRPPFALSHRRQPAVPTGLADNLPFWRVLARAAFRPGELARSASEGTVANNRAQQIPRTFCSCSRVAWLRPGCDFVIRIHRVCLITTGSCNS